MRPCAVCYLLFDSYVILSSGTCFVCDGAGFGHEFYPNRIPRQSHRRFWAIILRGKKWTGWSSRTSKSARKFRDPGAPASKSRVLRPARRIVFTFVHPIAMAIWRITCSKWLQRLENERMHCMQANRTDILYLLSRNFRSDQSNWMIGSDQSELEICLNFWKSGKNSVIRK